MQTTQPQAVEATLPGKEECPGHLEWSAFGASYMDTVCSSALQWSDPAEHPGRGILCDADDEFRPKDVPCPFCDPAAFVDYEWDDAQITWADGTPLEPGTEIHFHDGRSLTWSATHPERGEESVLIRSDQQDE